MKEGLSRLAYREFGKFPNRQRARTAYPRVVSNTLGPTILSGVAGTSLRGIYGLPWIPLEPLLDLAPLDAIHDELCLALASVPTEYTGGSHRSMGIMPDELASTAHGDYAEAIRAMSDRQFELFRSLADDPDTIDPALRASLEFGEEKDLALSRRQMLWLEYRHGVYFPWKVFYELIPNRWWSEKHSSEGKRFTRAAEALLPKTVAFVRSLPFVQIGRCNVMGLRANDHGTVHRDGDPKVQRAPDEFISLCPGANKTLFLYDRSSRERTPVTGRAYWFNDFDDHGVEAAPWFRYSLRVDGVFREEFREKVRSHARALYAAQRETSAPAADRGPTE